MCVLQNTRVEDRNRDWERVDALHRSTYTIRIGTGGIDVSSQRTHVFGTLSILYTVMMQKST